VYETDRAEEFSPVKNAEGVDSPETSRRDQIRRAARWLKEAGVEVPYRGTEPRRRAGDFPLLATSAQQLRTRKLPKKQINPGEAVYFE
jgi:UDP-N-acetylglucosamine/UDP-N-acetylgalactosamine diphosphorylase